MRSDGERVCAKFGEPVLPRKTSARGPVPPVPQTDTGGQVENTKASEIIVVKELGKMPP